jgi:hypothetical protein
MSDDKYLKIAKEQLAEYDLTIDDLTKEDLSDLIEELRDRDAGYVMLDGFFPIYATQLQREKHFKQMENALAKYSLKFEDLSKQGMSELFEIAFDKDGKLRLDNIESFLAKDFANGESATDRTE